MACGVMPSQPQQQAAVLIVDGVAGVLHTPLSLLAESVTCLLAAFVLISFTTTSMHIRGDMSIQRHHSCLTCPAADSSWCRHAPSSDCMCAFLQLRRHACLLVAPTSCLTCPACRQLLVFEHQAWQPAAPHCACFAVAYVASRGCSCCRCALLLSRSRPLACAGVADRQNFDRGCNLCLPL